METAGNWEAFLIPTCFPIVSMLGSVCFPVASCFHGCLDNEACLRCAFHTIYQVRGQNAYLCRVGLLVVHIEAVDLHKQGVLVGQLASRHITVVAALRLVQGLLLVL